jgi:Family of unknown function (DUF6263)
MKQIISACILFICLNAGAQTYKPLLKISEGKKFIVSSTTTSTMVQEVMGQSMEIPIEAAITNVLEIKKAASAEYDLTNSISRVVVHMSAMGQDINYDSDKPEDRNSPAGQDLNSMLNNPTDFKVNSFGKLIEGSVKKKSPEKPEQKSGSMLSGMVNMGDDKDPSQAVNIFDTDGPLNIGDSFIVKSASADGKNKKTATYTLKEIKDGTAKFIVSGIDSTVTEMETQGMNVVTNSTSKSTGEMLVNVNTGLLIKKVLNITVTGTVEVAGMNIPISGTTVTTINVTEAAK